MGIDTAVLVGIILVGLAGIATGSIVWPMKIIRKLQFEHYWFVGMLNNNIPGCQVMMYE